MMADAATVIQEIVDILLSDAVQYNMISQTVL